MFQVMVGFRRPLARTVRNTISKLYKSCVSDASRSCHQVASEKPPPHLSSSSARLALVRQEIGHWQCECACGDATGSREREQVLSGSYLGDRL